MLHLKMHLRFHFKKHKKMSKNVKKKMQLMVHLTMGSRVRILISKLALYGSFKSYIAQNKFLRVLYILYSAEHFQIRFHRESAYAGNRKKEVEGLVKVIYCFSGAVFFSKCMQGRLRIITILLISAYVLYG